MVVGALSCAVLTSCAGSSAAGSIPPPRSVIDTMTFAPSLAVDLSSFTRTKAGAYYRDVVRGSGDVAALNRTLTLKYAVALPNGTPVEAQTTPADILFDHSVIRGWREGIPGMRAGGRRLIIVPPELGYGRVRYGSVPPGSTLVFDIELLKVR